MTSSGTGVRARSRPTRTHARGRGDTIPLARPGGIYCSPGCGRGCTRAEYERTKALAEETAKRLGRKWKVVVFENLGWFARVVSPCGRLKVHPFSAPAEGYQAFLGEADSLGGRWAAGGKTPRTAVKAVINAARDDLASIVAVFDDLEASGVWRP